VPALLWSGASFVSLIPAFTSTGEVKKTGATPAGKTLSDSATGLPEPAPG
jgi:hypothetical protein